MNTAEAFEAGRRAGYEGLRVDHNPYLRVSWRRAWLDGWKVGAALARGAGSREQGTGNPVNGGEL